MSKGPYDRRTREGARATATELVVTFDELAALLKMNRKQVYRHYDKLVSLGLRELPRFSRVRRFSRASVERLIAGPDKKGRAA